MSHQFMHGMDYKYENKRFIIPKDLGRFVGTRKKKKKKKIESFIAL